MSDKNVQRVEMPPGFPELWEGVTNARMEIAELKGMMKMHFSDGKHHTPPCATATGLQKMLYTAMGAAILLGQMLWNRFQWSPYKKNPAHGNAHAHHKSRAKTRIHQKQNEPLLLPKEYHRK